MNLLTPSMLATIPPPPFRNVEVGPLTLHGYGLTMGLAIIAAIWIAEWGLKRQNVDVARFTPFALISVAGGFVGARLYHVASKPTYFLDHPGEIPAIWNGGLGIYGAVLGGGIVAYALAPKFALPRGPLADALAPALLAAQAIGRLGNYLNQELFGRAFDGAWALEVDERFRPAAMLDVATFHPTFLYEAVANGIAAVVLAVLLVRWTTRPRGILFWIYLATYSTVRICVEPLRIDAANEWLGVRQNVWVAGVLIAVGVAGAIYLLLRDRRARTA